ncbi:MAG: alpha/beta hydrolase family protein [Mycobacterium sp.]
MSHGGPTAMAKSQLTLETQFWTTRGFAVVDVNYGGSAGGYTTLCALVFHDEFKSGASYYGVADCETLDRDTHKFESRYLDGLIGPYPETAELYRPRADRLSCPVILFQGLQDRVMPPARDHQADIRGGTQLLLQGLPISIVR